MRNSIIATLSLIALAFGFSSFSVQAHEFENSMSAKVETAAFASTAVATAVVSAVPCPRATAVNVTAGAATVTLFFCATSLSAMGYPLSYCIFIVNPKKNPPERVLD